MRKILSYFCFQKYLNLVFFCAFFLGACDTKRVWQKAPTGEDPKGKASDNVTGAYLKIGSSASHNFGTVANGDTAEVTLTLENDGIEAAADIAVDTNLALPFRFKGGSYPGTGGTCNDSLAKGASCTLLLTFSPTAGGRFEDAFVLSYDNGADEELLFEYGVIGSSGDANITLSVSTPYSFANTEVGSTTSVTITLENEGELRASFITDSGLMSAPFAYKGALYPGTGGSCGFSLEPGATCTVILEYSPTTVGNHAGAWGLGFSSGGSAATVGLVLQGSSGLAELSISDGPTYNYGNVLKNSGLNKTFTISNTGDYQATSIADSGLMAAPFDFVGGNFPGTGGTCLTTLAAGASCTIIVRFSPTTLDAASGTLELDYNNGQSTQSTSVALLGTPLGADLSFTAEPEYNFNAVATGTVSTATLTLSNDGNYAASALAYANTLAGGGPFRFHGFAYPGTGGTCGTTLAAGATCTLVVAYAPPSNSTGQTDDLRINYNDGSVVTFTTINLTGRAGLGVLAISGTTNYGTRPLNSSLNRTFTITNSGTFDATEMEDAMSLAAPYSWAGSGSYPGGGTCSTVLAAGGQCTVIVRFLPTVVGTYPETLDINYFNGASDVVATANLTGVGGQATLTITDSPAYDFGAVAKNSVNERSFTISNTGNYAASAVADGAGLALPFRYKTTGYPGAGGNCGGTINAGASCQIVLAYLPTNTGAHNDTLVINFNDGVAVTQLTLDVSGSSSNTVPVANNLNESLPRDHAGYTINLSGSDANGDSLTYSIVTPPSNGALGAVVGNTVVYTPNASFFGADSFTYKVNDGTIDSATATVSIDVVDWYHPSWTQRIKINFNNAGRAENFVNIPVLVKLNSGRISYAQTQNSGQDIRFVDSDGTTLLSHEIERWNEAGDSFVWVKVPQINASSNADYIYMYYGNTGASDAQNAADVWSNGYEAVWHMNESPTGNILDSSGNGRHLAASGMTAGQLLSSGQIGRAISFDGDGDFLEDSDAENFLNGLSQITISLWARADSSNQNRGLFTGLASNPSRSPFYLNLEFDTSAGNDFLVAGVSAASTQGLESNNLGAGVMTAWRNYAYRWSSGNDVELFLDASSLGVSSPDPAAGGSLFGLDTFIVGRAAADGANPLQSFAGDIDELRISSTARSDLWINVERASQADSLNTYGSAETW